LRKRGSSRYRRLLKHQTSKNRKSTLWTVKTLNIQNKEQTLKASRKKQQVTYKAKTIRMTADFSIETLKAMMA
jgi:hypothetical protein